jgi:hypothetical protein
MSLKGPSESEKTYFSLLLGYSLTNDWSRIAVIDCENHNTELYSNLGKYNVIKLSAPYTPKKMTKRLRHVSRHANNYYRQ